MTANSSANLRNPGRLLEVRTVLVGSALDRSSDEVVRAARDLARAAGASLVVVHAAPMPIVVPGVLLTDSSIAESISAGLVRDLAAQAARLDLAAERPPVLRVEDGPPDLVLARIASEVGADLVVVGATTATGRLGKLLGSTAERLLAWGEAPVLVVREELRVPPLRVLAPVDLSLLSRDAFRAGLVLLGRLAPQEPVEVEALLVLPPPAPGELPHFVGKAEVELDDFVSSTPAPLGARILPRVLTGEAREQILRETEDVAWDLVLMGTRGAGGMRRALGSVAADVTREAPCSVLVVPPVEALGEAIAEAVQEQTELRWEPAQKGAADSAASAPPVPNPRRTAAAVAGVGA
jgi:nucleotide-binding universal stress UspA family protein